MATFRVHIKTDNAAFGDNPAEQLVETARILRELAKRLSSGHIGIAGLLYDINGNNVGSYALDESVYEGHGQYTMENATK